MDALNVASHFVTESWVSKSYQRLYFHFLHDSAGGLRCLPNPGASRWSDDVEIHSRAPLTLTTARDSWGREQASDSQQRCCLVLGWACWTRCSLLDLLTSCIFVLKTPYRPHNVWSVRVSIFKKTLANVWTRGCTPILLILFV